jgi:transcription antitermination factor NusA-like protein
VRDMDAEHITEALNSLLDRIEILENENLEMRVRISMLQKAQEKSEKNIITLSMITGKSMTKPRKKTQYQIRSERLQAERLSNY